MGKSFCRREVDNQIMKKYRLSKSKYLSGIQCKKKLWLEIHKPELIPDPPPAQQRIFDQGTTVGEMATDRFPGGVLIEADYMNIPKAIEQTNEALSQGLEIIFEGCFVNENVLVRPDVITHNEDDSWDIIEVKSSTSVKEVNTHDVAVQTWVLEGSNLKVSKKSLMHINRECVFPDLTNLFTIADITDQVNGLLPEVPARLKELKKSLESNEPDIGIGQHCYSPYECPFVYHCWNWIPEHSIFTIPRLRWSVKERLLANKRVELDNLPADFSLNETQLRYLKSVERKEPIVNFVGIKDKIEELEYPLYFLDFETDGPAVPWFNGLHPYEQFPFQFSCHILYLDDSLEHREYLHTEKTDPRHALAKALISATGKKGTVIAYNAGFEKGIISKLANWYPAHAQQLESISARLWDLLAVFRNYYMDWRFKGSFSLKSVLPVLIPDMTYDTLEVHDGGEAQVTWERMLTTNDDQEKALLIKGLIIYCRQDTLAMVELYKMLLKLE